MAQLYNNQLDRLLRGESDWVNATHNAVLVSSTYTFSPTHATLADVTGRISSAAISGKSVANGVADASDTVFTAVSGAAVVAVVVYQVGATEGASPLVAYNDDSASYPLATNGSDIRVNWHDTGGAFNLTHAA